MKKTLISLALAVLAAVSCDIATLGPETPKGGQAGDFNHLYLLNEGGFGSNNASLTMIDASQWTVSLSWYADVNGRALGDTGNDILVTEDYIFMTVGGSNLIQKCALDGKAAGQTEAVPSCRKMTTDGEYLYVTSYARNGYVAKVDPRGMLVLATCATGYEPEGIAYYGGKLYVANTGGNAWNGSHDYEKTISIIDAATMKEEKRVDTGFVNLYGDFTQNASAPRYILVNASGDYYLNPAGSCIFDCETGKVVATYDFPATYSSSYGSKFYILGSTFSYVTYAYEYSLKTIDMSTGSPVVTDGIVSADVSAEVEGMDAPYGLFFAPDGEFFITDAGDYTNRGHIYRFSSSGTLLSKSQTGVCPGHIAFD